MSHCSAQIAEHGSVFVSLFLAGLLGSLTHCTGMCGPFVASQVLQRLEQTPLHGPFALHRVRAGLALPYQAGRATTYTMLGGLAGAFSAPLMALPQGRLLAAALLTVAALMFAAAALGRRLRVPGLVIPAWLLRTAGPLFQRPLGLRGYALGLLLGFLPCGLLVAALVAAAATGSPVAGALAMACFAVGTFPLLAGVGVGVAWAQGRWPTPMKTLARFGLGANALGLVVLAGRIVL